MEEHDEHLVCKAKVALNTVCLTITTLVLLFL